MAVAEKSQAHGMDLNGDGVVLSSDGWYAEAPPELVFLTEAWLQLQLPPTTTGTGPGGQRVIFNVTGGTFDGPNLRWRVTEDAGADWMNIRADGVGGLEVRFWRGPADAEYATDITKADDPNGAWRYYFRVVPQFETGASRYARLNNISAVTKSRTGDGGPIHRFYAVL